MKDQTNRINIHRRAWLHKDILREVYRGWHTMICKDLATQKGHNLELGAGIGNFKNFRPDFIASDVKEITGLDLCLDAHHLPFARQRIANIVMIDVLHHLDDPLQFFHQAGQALSPGGRIIIMEPFITLFSWLIYSLFHRETMTWQTDYFTSKIEKVTDPWQGNLAMANLLFYRSCHKLLQELNGALILVKKEILSCLLYPLSGGFEGPSLLPDFLLPTFRRLERMLKPVRSIMAFRCYVVMERGNNHVKHQ